MRTSKLATILPLFCTLTCQGDPPAECIAGTEACECIEGGLCVAGLVCESNLCVDLQAGNESDDGDGSSAGPKPDIDDEGSEASDGETGEPGSCAGLCGDQGSDGMCWCDTSCMNAGDCCSDYETACALEAECLYNSDCADDYACSPSLLSCVEATSHSYDVHVSWKDHTPGCFDVDVDDCLADVYLVVHYGGDLLYVSPAQPNVLEASFDFGLTANEIDGLTLVFYDDEAVGDSQYLTAMCAAVDGECSSLTPAMLHDSLLVWDLTDDPDPQARFFVSLLFSPL